MGGATSTRPLGRQDPWVDSAPASLGRGPCSPIQTLALVWGWPGSLTGPQSWGPQQACPQFTCEAPPRGQQGLPPVPPTPATPQQHHRFSHGKCCWSGLAGSSCGPCTVVVAQMLVNCAALWVGGYPWTSWIHTSAGRVTTVQGRGQCGACGPLYMVLRTLPSCLWATGFGLTALPGLWGHVLASALAGGVSK